MEQTRDGLNLVKCPICEEVVTKSIQSHVEKCLEKFKRAEASNACQETCVCVICRVDITNLEASQRTAHVNRCLDEECNEPVQEPVVSTPSHSVNASFELLDCPLCERSFKSSKACKVHIKQCSVHLNMSPKQVIDAIRLQQRYLQERLAAGLPLIHRRKARPEEPIQRPAKRPRPAATIPKSKFQEEIQMAKALSASITEQGSSRGRTRQQIPGHVSTRRKRVKREERPTPALLTTTGDERTKMVESRISRLLASTVAGSLEKHVCVLRQRWAAQLRPSVRLHELAEKGPSTLWTKAAQSISGKGEFYVATLNNTVTHCVVEAGSKLRSLSQVPGHRISNAAQFEHLDDQYGSFLESQRPVKEEPATQDHQAAVLSLIGTSLQQDKMSDSVGHGFLSQKHSESTTRTHLEESWESKSMLQLSCDLNSRVGSSRYADLRISVEGGKTVHAHRVIVYARCPSLENDVVKSNGANCLNWSEWSESCVRTFLTYLYAGTIDRKLEDRQLALQLRSLAFRYNASSLCKYLEENLGDFLDDQASLNNSLAEIITSLWDEEAISRVDSEEVEETAADDDVQEFDDVYEFVASQRPRKFSDSSHVPSGSAANLSQTNDEGSQCHASEQQLPQTRTPAEGQERLLQPPPSQLRSQSPRESHLNSKAPAQGQLERRTPELQVLAASQVDYKRSPRSQPHPQLYTESSTDLPHQSGPQQLSTCETSFERHSQSRSPQQFPPSLEAVTKTFVKHNSPEKQITTSYSAASIPIAISPIPSEDEHPRIVPSKILSLPLPPTKNGHPWYSPSSAQNAPSTTDSSNEPNASDAESAELFGSCDEVESNPEPQITGDSDGEQLAEVPDEDSSSAHSMQSIEEKQRSDQENEEDMWDSVWEGFGDQGHSEVPELMLSPMGDSKDIDVMSNTKELVQEQFRVEEADGRSAHCAMMDSHFFDEEPSNQPQRSLPYTSPLTSRGRTPASVVTPLLDYDAMQTPELKGQLQRFGVRAFPRKKAVNILRHIYEETHPYVPQTPRRPPYHSRSAERADSGEPSHGSGTGDDDCTESRSSSSSSADVGELESQGDESDCHSEVDVIGKMREFIRTNQQLYQRVVSYEPIDLRTLHDDMKGAKIKVSLKALMDFLDQQCITYRQPRTEKQRLKQQRRQKRFRQRVRAKISSSQT